MATIVRVCVCSHGQRQGEVFIPMHWNDHFASHGRAGALLAGLVDPLSGQPESKHGAVDVMPLPCEWQATLLIAPGVWGGHEDLAGAMTELEGCYWARIRRRHWCAVSWQEKGSRIGRSGVKGI